MRILVTRPAPDGERTAQKLRARGCDVVLEPVLRIRLLDQTELGSGPWDAVAMTSANAAHALERHSRRQEVTRLPVLTVGRRTAEAAGAIGFAEIASANGNEQALAHLIGTRLARGNKILYLAGEDRAGDLATAVAPHGVRIETVVVYRAVAADRLSHEAAAALRAEEVNGVLH